MRKAPLSVDEYIADLPEPARGTLTKVRAAIRSALPAEATEVISYRIPAFRHKVVLVWFAAFSKHWSLFPSAAIIEQFKDELKGFVTSKGTLQVPLGRPPPIALIKKLVKARLAQVAAKKKR